MSADGQQCQLSRFIGNQIDGVPDGSPLCAQSASPEDPFMAMSNEGPHRPYRILQPSQELVSVFNSCRISLQRQQKQRIEAAAQSKVVLDQKIAMNITKPLEKVECGTDTARLQRDARGEHGCRDQKQLCDPFTPPAQLGLRPRNNPRPSMISRNQKGGLKDAGQIHQTPTPSSWNPELRPPMTTSPMALFLEHIELKDNIKALTSLLKYHLGLNDGEVEFLVKMEMAKMELKGWRDGSEEYGT
ncbi:hypothetical protein PV10_02990 [Exophiala mesophila]|uniref:Uncharacterized protein n=1 Tax=Exophiala mesophila TaxID=212818 RepID=A0A0D1X0L9_EXOME|nr:uncharacterized protein PV10_02990 [Exophiala mesophila]KIV95320.1 hypothetical protein PV10_02990 [Exophiala mesophila]